MEPGIIAYTRDDRGRDVAFVEWAWGRTIYSEPRASRQAALNSLRAKLRMKVAQAERETRNLRAIAASCDDGVLV